MNNINNIRLNIPLTIEKQLENYSRKEGHTERHETMWHAWCQNKRWLGQMLQVTLHSFPTYSRHDETHALTVLNNIEMLLGEERIAELSATDCFVLLHTVYIHDIGMCITQRDRKEIIENERFINLIDELQKDGDDTTRHAIEVLKCTDYSYRDEDEYITRMKQIYRAKLDVYYAIIQLMENYRRIEHGNKTSEIIYEWTLEPDKLGAGFSMAGVPLRIFLAIARCAELHTSDDFNDVIMLPWKDGGYASDYYHPRFIAVLLMLGDLLDMDNDRFHPMVFEFVENFPEMSKNHYDKHRSIRKLHISPTIIEIEADCGNQKALRLVRKECEMLMSILREAGYRWSTIRPEQFSGSLPTLGDVHLFLNRNKIPEELVTAQFNISQKKAFFILEGSNLYEGKFVFLREFVQNAIDASKIQYWYDYEGMISYYYGKEVEKKSPYRMNLELPFDKYPIEVGMKMQKRNNDGKLSDISEEDIRQIEKDSHIGYEYGVTVSIKDFGTGIDKKGITSISEVGNSRLKDRKIIRKMPEWLRPTAEFGVGLQSAFLVTGSFKCITHTRSGEKYEITFNSGSSSKYEGYINVIPLEETLDVHKSFGTCFEVFVSLDKKLLHSESVHTWSGSDPFCKDYENGRPFRHAAELISQMSLYLDNILGEQLFPIILKINNKLPLNLSLNTNKNNTLHKMVYGSEYDWKKSYKKLWIFQNTEKNPQIFFGETQNIIYAFEYESSRLFLWNQDINTFCIVSGKNLLEKEAEQEHKQHNINKSGITIYYKGIEMQRCCIKEEIEMFESIDIKGELERAYINISRRGFTPEGLKYFEKNIYEELVSSVRTVLKYINDCSRHKNFKQTLINNINKKINQLSEYTNFSDKQVTNYSTISQLANQIISLSYLAYLALKDTHDEMSQLGSSCGKTSSCIWQQMIGDVCAILNQNIKVRKLLKDFSVFFNIGSFTVSMETNIVTYIQKERSVLDIFNNNNHYGLLQTRKSQHAEWKTYIIEIEETIYHKFENLLLDTFQQFANEEAAVIKRWLNSILYSKDMLEEKEKDDRGYKQQFLLTWLAQTMPVLAVTSNHNGNTKFNVLSNYIFPCIYANEEQKILIVKKIMQIANDNQIQRFSTYAWQGRQYLSVLQIPFSCYFVKRGYMNHSSLQQLIFPLNGDLLKEIGNILNNVDNLEFVQNVQMLTDRLDYKKYFSEIVNGYEENMRLNSEEKKFVKSLKKICSQEQRSVTSLILGGNEFFGDLINSANWKENINLVDNSYFERLKMSESAWKTCYINIMNLWLRMQNIREVEPDTYFGADNLYKDDIIKDICTGWYFLKDGVWKEMNNSEFLKISKLKKEYLDKCKNDESLKINNQKILKYIYENSRYPIRHENLEKCFTAFVEEIFSLYEIIEKRNVKAKLEKILQNI